MKIILNFFSELVILTIKLITLLAIAGVIFLLWAQNDDILGSIIMGTSYAHDFSGPFFWGKIVYTVIHMFFLITFYFLFFLEYKGSKKDPGLVDIWKQILGR